MIDRFIPRTGPKIKHKFYGVHGSIRLDINSLGEILMKQMVNRAGGSEVSMYDDLALMISPQHNTRTMLLNLARYEGIYLDEQFESGRDGTKWELDDITYNNGAGVQAQDMFLAGSFLMFLSVMVVFGTLFSDLALAALDPRIRLTGGPAK